MRKLKQRKEKLQAETGKQNSQQIEVVLVRMSAAKQRHVWLLDNLFAPADFRSWLCLARQVELGQGHVPELISDFYSQHAALPLFPEACVRYEQRRPCKLVELQGAIRQLDDT